MILLRYRRSMLRFMQNFFNINRSLLLAAAAERRRKRKLFCCDRNFMLLFLNLTSSSASPNSRFIFKSQQTKSRQSHKGEATLEKASSFGGPESRIKLFHFLFLLRLLSGGAREYCKSFVAAVATS